MHIRKLLAHLWAVPLLSLVIGMPAASSETKEPEVCILAGIEVPKQLDADCPKDILSALRAFYFDYEALKLDKEGKPVIDEKTGEAVMETRRETFGMMADLFEWTGFGDSLKGTPSTVFAIPDSVLSSLMNPLNTTLKDADEESRAAVMAQLAAVAGSHALNEPLGYSNFFRSANGKVWTMAGGWQTKAPPLAFYALSGDGSVKVNGVMLGYMDIPVPDGGIIHTIATPLVPFPKPKMEPMDRAS